MAVNYNRDVEVFPVVKRILEKITGGDSFYKSPTDMGVNRAGFAIIDDDVTRRASEQEVLRRYYRYRCEYVMGFADKETVQRVELFIKDFGIKPEDRRVVAPAWRAAVEAQEQNKGNEGIYCGAAIELKDGTIITGNNSPLMHAASSLILHTIKYLADIPDKIMLLPRYITDSVQESEDGYSRGKVRQSRSGGDAHRPEHQRHDESGGATGHRKTQGTEELRGSYDPHAHAGRRGGSEAPGSQSDQRAQFCHQGSIPGLTAAVLRPPLWYRFSRRPIQPFDEHPHF